MTNEAPSDKKAALLSAAIAEFGEKGYDGASVRGIAARASVAKGTVYLYFRDKDELFAAAFAQGWEGFFRDTEHLSSGAGSPRERLASLAALGLGKLGEAYPLVRGMLFEASRRGLLGAQLDRLSERIGLLVAEDSGGGIETSRNIARVLVAGILFEIAAAPSEGLEEAFARIRATASAALEWAAQRT